MGWVYNAADNVPTDGPKITAICIIFTTISLVLVSLRIFVRLGMIKNHGMDDWTIVLAFILSVGFTIVTVLQTLWGLGIYIPAFPTEDIMTFSKLQFAGAPFYILGILCFKLSLLLSYLRIAKSTSYSRGIWVIIAATVAFHISFLFAQIFLCTPVSFQWNQNQPGKCLFGPHVYFTMASLTIVFDVIVIATPIPLLLRTQLRTRKKLVLVGLFAIGFFITVIQFVRIFTIKSLSNPLDSASLIMWSSVELNLGIWITCIPTLSPLFRYFKEQHSSGASGAIRSTRQGTIVGGRGGGRVHHELNDFAKSPAASSGAAKTTTSNSSEEYIIRPGAGIHTTTDITVTAHHEPRRDGGLDLEKGANDDWDRRARNYAKGGQASVNPFAG